MDQEGAQTSVKGGDFELSIVVSPTYELSQ